MIARLVTVAAVLAGCAHESRTQPAAPQARATPAGRSDDAPPPGSVRAVGAIVIEDDLGLLPNVRLDTVKLASGLDLAAVVDRLRAELPHFRSCFSSQVTPRPRRALTLTLTFRIDSSRRVIDANVHGTDVPALRQCIAAALTATEGFPQPRGGGSIDVEASLVVSPVR